MQNVCMYFICNTQYVRKTLIHAFYPFLDLWKRLLSLGFGSCGTVRLNRTGLPPNFKNYKLKKGEMVSFKDGGLTGVRWMDKHPVALLSTIHNDSTATVTRRSRAAAGSTEMVSKPVMITAYTNFMGGVDVADQLVTYYGFAHCSKKWWKRAFFHLLEVCMVNAYILYSSSHQSISHVDFILTVARELLEKSGHELMSPSPSLVDQPQRLVGRNHFPEPSGKRRTVVCAAVGQGKGSSPPTSAPHAK